MHQHVTMTTIDIEYIDLYSITLSAMVKPAKPGDFPYKIA